MPWKRVHRILVIMNNAKNSEVWTQICLLSFITCGPINFTNKKFHPPYQNMDPLEQPSCYQYFKRLYF